MVQKVCDISSKYPGPFLLTDLGLIVFFLGGLKTPNFVPSNTYSLQKSLKNPLLILTYFFSL